MFRNVSFLVGANAFAQFLNLSAYPLLAYLYSPTDFGIFGAITSVGLLFGVVVCARIDTIIQLESRYSEKGLLQFSLVIGCLGAIFSGAVCYSYLSLTSSFVSEGDAFQGKQLVLSAIFSLIVFGNGFQPVCRQLGIKYDLYRKVAISQIVRVFCALLIQIGIGLLYPSYLGLLSGFVIGLFVSVLLIFPYDYFNEKIVSRFSVQKGKVTAKNSRKIIAVDSLNVFITTATSTGLIFSITVLYGVSEAGIFLLAMKLVFVPIEVIGGAISSVYFQKLSKMVRDGTVDRRPFFQVLLLAAFVIIPVSTGIIYFSEFLFDFFLPSKWTGASSIAIALVPLLVAKMAISAVGYTALSLRRPVLITIWNTFQIVVLAVLFGYTFYEGIMLEEFISIYGAVIVVGSIVYLIVLERALARAEKKAINL